MFIHGIGEHALLIDSFLITLRASPKMKLSFDYRIPLSSFRMMGFIEDASHCDRGEGA